MLSPQTLSRLPDPLVDLINELQTDIIRSIAEKLTKANYLTPSAEWQLYKAQQLRLSTDEVNKLLKRYTKLSHREIRSIYTDACKQAISNDASIYRQFGKDAESFFRSVAFSNVLKAGIKNANGMFENFTRSTVQSSRKTVTHLMDKAYLQVLSGAFSPQEAIYSAVRELADKGIQSVTYPSGRTDWADVAVRRAVITGIGQTTGQMQLDLAAEMGTDLVEVTSHMGARPSHAEWQGKVYSISGKSKKYPSLRAATGYGRGDGLKGWNCRHDFFPFFEGLSERANLPVDPKENEKQYNAEQKQRAIERAIRKSKRGLAALDSSIQSTDDEQLKAKLQSDFDRKAATLKRQEQRLAEYCKANDLFQRNDRTRVVGFGRSVSQKAVHGNKKYLAKQLDKSVINGTIDSEEYAKMLKNRQIVDISTLDPNHKSLSIKGTPGSIVDLIEDGKVMQRRIFGYDGKAIVDFDTTDHNQPSQHPTGAHKHIFDYSKRNPHGTHRKITDHELEMNRDIIQRGVNYFDEEGTDRTD
ncbi:Phage minor capsid protein 2 [Ruminococcus sp. YE71]|uniref:phage minor capsid protein n=1 Tax=unclassified Ruminococcus TaxID=2608920 RepID=UPI00088F580B|nr:MULTISPECIES: phage minor capsid protein [unclassified Ruminococcus]SDA20096.1 Phage minor capsid protein 2 [Ruminococcus sp. YE78]SFW31813.1 Phage minor capsid protein 2 [Ruminococcus sp. YE71]